MASYANNVNTTFPWANGEPTLSYNEIQIQPSKNPLSKKTRYDPMAGNYCGFLKGATNFKVSSILCDNMEAFAVCKKPRGK